MAKKKGSDVKEVQQSSADARPQMMAAPAVDGVHSFETKPKCPRCSSTDSRCYATKRGVQYRECRFVVCRLKFTVRGKIVL